MSALTMRTIAIPGNGGHRTTMRLEPEYWSALIDMAVREGVTVGTLVARFAGSDRDPGNCTSAVRVHVLRHYRDAARAAMAEATSNA